MTVVRIHVSTGMECGFAVTQTVTFQSDY